MKWLILGSLIAATLVELPAPVIRTQSGLVRGRISADGKFYTYFGIPYGTVNESNRFQAPLPPPKWDGIFEAINFHSRCPQRIIGSMIIGEADCLKLHIYTPVTRGENPLPVMVFIHGGCFIEGTGSAFLYGGDFFAQHGVILVGINYRLNVEGFLCLGIKEAPGNAGLKDQIAALKWLKKNIKAFGGDPDNVTLFGESAGASSTSFLMLSKAAKGLFQKAILQSGSSLSPWALQHNPIETARALAQSFGCYSSDPKELYNVLRNRTAEELIMAIKNPKYKKFVTADVLFTPCIENKIPDVEPIMTEHPTEIITSGNYSKIPMIIGFNDKEGIYFAAADYGLKLKEINAADVIRTDLKFPNEFEKNSTVERIVDQYFTYSNIIDGAVNLYSDLHVKFPSALESELYAKTTDQPIYFYLFKYSGYINMPKMISLFWFTKGASHADELFYLFKAHSFPLPHRFLERTMLERMLMLWTNFAKYSDPTPKTTKLVPLRWRAARVICGGAGACSAHAARALHIDSTLGWGPLWDAPQAAWHLWNDTYSKFRRRDYGFNKTVNEV